MIKTAVSGTRIRIWVKDAPVFNFDGKNYFISEITFHYLFEDENNDWSVLCVELDVFSGGAHNELLFNLNSSSLPDWVRGLADIYVPGSGFMKYDIEPDFEF